MRVLGTYGPLLPGSPASLVEEEVQLLLWCLKFLLCLAACSSGVVLQSALVVAKIISFFVAGETRCLLKYNVMFDFYVHPGQSASSLTELGTYFNFKAKFKQQKGRNAGMCMVPVNFI